MTPATARCLPPPSGRIGIGSIGFSGPDLKGSVSVAAEEALWKGLAAPVDPDEPPFLTDLVAEFANMLLGRARNALLPIGVEISMALPSAALGTDVAFHRTTGDRPDWDVFLSPSGPVFVRCAAAFRKDFSFSPDSEWSVHPNEADLVLF